MKNLSFYLILLLVGLSACRKNIDDLEVIREEGPPIVLVETNLRGKIVGEDGQAIPFAAVTFANEVTQTDEDGNFYFQDVEVNKSGAIVTAELDGYFKGIAHSRFSAEGNSYVQVNMMERGDPRSLESSQGGSYTDNDGMKVDIPANAMATSAGGSYSGAINVYSRWIDPTDENMGGIMPGALTATADDGSPLVLASFGMLALEIESGTGVELQLRGGQAIDVEMPIPDELLAQAPDEIPLWLYDLEAEQWLNSGVCYKVGNVYKCKITKFGFWNCDIDLPAICLSGQVFNSDSTFSPYLKVIVEDLADNFVYWGYTDSTGYFCGAVPAAADLLLTIKDHCDSVIYSEEIGPFAQDFQIPDIYLDANVSSFMINLMGTVQHCTSNDVPFGHVSVTLPGRIRIFPFVDGQFDINMAMNCVEFPELKIQTFSLNAKELSETVMHTTSTDLDLGLQETCASFTDIFELTVDGTEYWTAPTQWYLKDNSTTNWMVLEGLSSAGKFVLDILVYSGPGTYSSNVFFNVENDTPAPEFPLLNALSPNITLTIDSDDGTFIAGSFTGTALDITGAVRTIESSFLVRKAP